MAQRVQLVSAQAQTAGMELQGNVPAQPARNEPAALPVLPPLPVLPDEPVSTSTEEPHAASGASAPRSSCRRYSSPLPW